ncbi:hypothetical protein AAE478_003513 [Parahypoxylon ruwenzoriense]
MPPNSFCEWVLGQNVIPRASSQTRRVFSVDLETDDESESDILKVTFPRTGRAKGNNVRFSEASRPETKASPINLRPAIKTRPIPEKEVMEDLESSEEEVLADEEPSPDCPCANCIAARRKKGKYAKLKKTKKRAVESSADDSGGSAAAVHAKHKAKNARKVHVVKSSKANNARQKSKTKGKKAKEQSDTESETSDTTDVETESEAEAEAESDIDTDTGGESETESESESEQETPKKVKKSVNGNRGKKREQGKPGKQRKKSKGDRGNKGTQEKRAKPQKGEQGKEGGNTEESRESFSFQSNLSHLVETPEKRSKKEKPLPPHNAPAEFHRGNFLLPPRSRVLQVEHAVEAPGDPRPNAFFDNGNGVMRVFHGPAYGNPQGILYPQRGYYDQNLPIGTPHPAMNPWYNGFAPDTRQSAPRDMPPPTPTPNAPQENSWFQGYGTTTIGRPAEEPSVPDFTSGFDQSHYQEMFQEHDSSNLKPSKPNQNRRDQDGRSNVVPIPSVDVSSPESRGSGESGDKPWDTQGAHGSRKGSGSRRKSKKNGNGRTNDGDLSNLSKDEATRMCHSLKEIIARDKAKAKEREAYQEKELLKVRGSSPPSQDNNVQADTGSWGGNGNGADSGKSEGGRDGGNLSADNGAEWTNTEAEWGGDANASNGSNGSNGSNRKSRNNAGNGGSDDHHKDTSHGNKGGSSRSVPGGWVSPRSNHSGSSNGSPSRAGLDNVGGNWDGNDNKDAAWQDSNVAQSSGGAFDDDENGNKENDDGTKPWL